MSGRSGTLAGASHWSNPSHPAPLRVGEYANPGHPAEQAVSNGFRKASQVAPSLRGGFSCEDCDEVAVQFREGARRIEKVRKTPRRVVSNTCLGVD